jgi:CheY-like chemotaxis protein
MTNRFSDFMRGGYPTKEAGDAEEAMRILADGRVTVIITDIDMPGSMDGLAFAGSDRRGRTSQ